MGLSAVGRSESQTFTKQDYRPMAAAPLTARIGLALRLRREATRMSQRRFPLRAGVNVLSYSCIERGKQNVRIELLDRICQVLERGSPKSSSLLRNCRLVPSIAMRSHGLAEEVARDQAAPAVPFKQNILLGHQPYLGISSGMTDRTIDRWKKPNHLPIMMCQCGHWWLWTTGVHSARRSAACMFAVRRTRVGHTNEERHCRCAGRTRSSAGHAPPRHCAGVNRYLSNNAEVCLSPIAKLALHWVRLHPDMPAIQILDCAMAGYEGTDPDFVSYATVEDGSEVFMDELEPPSLMTELIRRAFTPSVAGADLLLLGADVDTSDAILCQRIESIAADWQGALLQFATRYRLWEP
jgi:transcriptional regulator with XRE-family HTH domain